MRLPYLVALCLAAAASPAGAETWYRLAAQPASLTYADADTVERHELAVTLEVLTSYAVGRGQAGNVFYSSDVVELNCDENRFRVVLITQLDDTLEIVGNHNGFDSAWLDIAPGSVAERFRRFACDGGLRDAPVDEPFADAFDHWEP
jgi:hypothetical protein